MNIKSLSMSLSSIIATTLGAGQALAQDATSATAPIQVPAGAAAGAAPAGAGWLNFALIGGMILFMWLFVFRPQAKRAKEQKAFLASLTAGSEVITAGGIIGTVVEVKENIVSLNVGNSTVRVLKSSISGRLDSASTAVPAK
ncbi:preprotein translocase subunit YajC [Fluviispira vulneris]|uniref:preprotein translocase subunit YajC n=1 Tax=Fluviispira vulneris TaxID=2763012 RepID=UPI001C9513B7|nr:preprotein translocase subunit YajC [Fluviispira vulneris]